MRIDADAGAAGRMPGGDAPGRGHEVVGVFGVDAAFDGMAPELDVLLLEAELFAGGDAYLLLHDVDAGDHFGDRMFDLHAGVHFDEEELAVLVQELERARAAIADLAAGFGAAFADLVAQLGALSSGAGASSMIFWWRRCIEQSRSPRIDGVAMLVGQHLDLDMARVLQKLLHVHHGIAEGGLRFVCASW